jgi:hypothetical protein
VVSGFVLLIELPYATAAKMSSIVRGSSSREDDLLFANGFAERLPQDCASCSEASWYAASTDQEFGRHDQPDFEPD